MILPLPIPGEPSGRRVYGRAALAGRQVSWMARVRHPVDLPEGLPHGVPGAELREVGWRFRRGLPPEPPRGRALPGRWDASRAPGVRFGGANPERMSLARVMGPPRCHEHGTTWGCQ